MNAIRKYCLVRNSTRLKTAIAHRLESTGKSKLEICRKLKIPTAHFYDYFNDKHAKRITQYNLIRFAQELGIKIDLDIKFE